MREPRLDKEYEDYGSLSWYGSYISNREGDGYDCDNNKKSLCCKIATWRGENNIPTEHIRKIKITQNNGFKRK